MKTTSKILSVLLALVMVLSLATVTFAAEEEKCIELTATKLGLEEKYKNGTATVDEVGMTYTELYCKDAGIQMRYKSNVASKIANTDAIPGVITKIELIGNAKQAENSNKSDIYSFTFGNSTTELGHSVSLSTLKGQANYTITPDAETYTYFAMEHTTVSGSSYWDSIKIYYKEATQAPVETPTVAEKVTVHAKVPASWGAANLWAWGSEGNAFEAWPGEAMTLNNGWYEIEMPNWVTGLLLNYNGDANKTGDIAVEAGKEVWIVLSDDLTPSVTYTNPDAQKPADKNNAGTGDATALVAISAAMLLAATGVVAVVSNKKHF